MYWLRDRQRPSHMSRQGTPTRGVRPTHGATASPPSSPMVRRQHELQAQKNKVRLPVLLYIPNIICYMRIFLTGYAVRLVAGSVSRPSRCSIDTQTTFSAIGWLADVVFPVGLGTAKAAQLSALGEGIARGLNRWASVGSDSRDYDRVAALVLFGLSALGDALDGYVARKLNQTSKLGVVVDVVTDIFLRSSMWLCSALVQPRYAPAALLFLTSEYLTFLCNQLASERDGGRHWKELRASDPAVIKYFFSNQFRNPLGALGIAGLFVAPVLPLLTQSFPKLAQSEVYEYACVVFYVGRLMSLSVELYFIGSYVNTLVALDEKAE